jgi:hypothetical protein
MQAVLAVWLVEHLQNEDASFKPDIVPDFASTTSTGGIQLSYAADSICKYFSKCMQSHCL